MFIYYRVRVNGSNFKRKKYLKIEIISGKENILDFKTKIMYNYIERRMILYQIFLEQTWGIRFV